MPATTASNPNAISTSTGLIALLKAMGLSAVQVSPEVVALQTKPVKA